MTAQRTAALVVALAAIMGGGLWSALRGQERIVPGGTIRRIVPLRTEQTGGSSTGPANVVAEAKLDSIGVYARPNAPAPTVVLGNPNERGAPRVFLVIGRRGSWLRVLVPVRPNESTGWVRVDDVTLRSNPYELDVELHRHRLTVLRGGEEVLHAPIGVGRGATQTPDGLYFLT